MKILTKVLVLIMMIHSVNVFAAAKYDKENHTCSTYKKEFIGECGNYPGMIDASLDWFIKYHGKKHGITYLSDIKNINGAQFPGSLLPALELSMTQMLGVNFSDSDLDYIDFDRSICHHANFENSKLQDASLMFVKCRNANFNNIKAQGINFGGAKLNNSTFINANLEDANFGDAKGANFTDANLKNADLAHGDFTKADFTNADLRGANLSGATFTDAIFYNTKLDAAYMFSSVLIGADMKCADFGRAYSHESTVTNDLKSDDCTKWPERTKYGLPTKDNKNQEEGNWFLNLFN